jgi:hypothetical protein
MTEYDERYITIFNYDLTGAVIERIEWDERDLNLYLSTHRMNIPDDVQCSRNDGCYLLSFIDVQVLRADFALLGADVVERLSSEGNEIHAYGFMDEKLADEQTADAIAVYFDTDWGLLEVASTSISYSV